jgi:hypothetical protein
LPSTLVPSPKPSFWLMCARAALNMMFPRISLCMLLAMNTLLYGHENNRVSGRTDLLRTHGLRDLLAGAHVDAHHDDCFWLIPYSWQRLPTICVPRGWLPSVPSIPVPGGSFWSADLVHPHITIGLSPICVSSDPTTAASRL